MAHKTLAVIAVLSLAGILFLVYLAMTFESPEGTRTVDIAQPVPRPVEPLRPVERPEPAEQTTPIDRADTGLALEPLPEPEIEDEVEPMEELPSLNESDALVMSRLAGMELGATLLRLLTPEEVIRRFVVFTDNAARGELPQLDYPLRPPEQSMPVRALDDNLHVMEESAHRRFDRMVDTLVALDVRHAMQIYRALRPLMEEAYAELGYPDADFDQVVIAAIDRVLEAEVVEGPYQLIDPGVMYEFAESEVESLSPLSKQLIRIGPENTERLRERLREYRSQLVLGASA